MDTQTITHAPRRYKSPLQVEITTKALRHSVWVSLYLAQELHLDGLTHALTRTLVEVDRLLGEFDLA
jgi:hypothetical protein